MTFEYKRKVCMFMLSKAMSLAAQQPAGHNRSSAVDDGFLAFNKGALGVS
jgi:hypothetical protein